MKIEKSEVEAIVESVETQKEAVAAELKILNRKYQILEQLLKKLNPA